MTDLPSYERWGDLTGKRVLVRVDFNTPVAEIDGELHVTDDFRIRSTIPLFEDLLARGATVVACTHFGRPKGHVVAKYSVAPVRARLAELCAEVELMENLRFNPGEESDDPAFGASLVEGFDYYINEAFSASHRAHASIMIPPTLLPSAAGPNLQREVTTIQSLLTSPERPFVAIVGGAKVADKLGIVRVLADKAQTVLVGGGMAYTFEVTQGRTIGSSLFDGLHLDECAALLKEGHVLIPDDSRGLKDGQPFGNGGGDDEVIDFGANVPDGFVGLDIGPQAVATFCAAIGEAKTILWNGPMGVFEVPECAVGTFAIAKAIAANSGAVSIIGGGDSVSAIKKAGVSDKVSFISTGGGASLEFLEGRELPGVASIPEKK